MRAHGLRLVAALAAAARGPLLQDLANPVIEIVEPNDQIVLERFEFV
jgi:hypothetical protein